MTNIHKITGAITVLIFLGTGIYMKLNFPDIYGDNEIIRYQFRANHVYILFSGIINLLAGLIPNRSYQGWKKIANVLSVILIIAATILLIAAFIVEPINAEPLKPITLAGVFSMLFGVILLLLSKIKDRHS